MLSDLPFTQDLVLVGGGHAHALVLRHWGMNPLPGARLTVINPGPTAPYTGMLPGHVAGHYGRDDLEIDLVRLCQHAGARLILDKACGIDRQARQVLLEGRGPIAYDVASVDVGITSEMDLPGFADHGIGAKPLDRFAARWRAFRDASTAGKADPAIAVIGGGVAGCELAMAMAHALRERRLEPAVTVIEAGPEITGVGDRGRAILLDEMRKLGIAVRCGANVTAISATQVILEQADPIMSAFTVGAAGAFPHPWIGRTDLPLCDGFIEVGPDLGVRHDPSLFAVGDCARMIHAPRPKAGVFAVRAAPVLHHNLRAALSGGTRRDFNPQKNYLKLISLGGKSAMAEKYGLTLKGRFMWRWKDRIDRAFMDRLSDLPKMQRAAPSGPVANGLREVLQAKPLCGGCGAKVGQSVLSASLNALPVPKVDVLAGAGEDAAVLRGPDGGHQVLSTDHLRAFIADPEGMARIALVHALGDIWAMGAVPQAVLASIILPQMTAQLQARTLEEINQAIGDILSETGGQLVGGHTTMGAELTIGFTVTGTRKSQPITLAGAKPGDVLLLTRPIGAGVILAGHMQGLAPGPTFAAALARMAEPQHRAAKVLAKAHAMTDVTGFGLAGHVQAMARASDVGIVLHADHIPVYDGARALTEAGVGSSLMPTNRADAPIKGGEDPLLYDPQTAGGLLAAISADQVDAVLSELKAVGATGYLIGRILKGPAGVTMD